MFAVVLHALISWPYCSLCIVKECCLSSALLYEMLYCCNEETQSGESRTPLEALFDPLRSGVYALVGPGMCFCCPLLSKVVDLGLSALLSVLLSCFSCLT